MKFRCVKNSIRIRIRKSDMKQLAETGQVIESVAFPAGNSFSFQLSLNEKAEAITATYQDNIVEVHLPENAARNWIESSEISLTYEQTLTNGETLQLLIEKDLPCTDRADEDKSDTFQELSTEAC